ncbi:Eci1 [Symbiodinium sp. KB8]|nr:Eci1 [Symbiodinium sp. KB8]
MAPAVALEKQGKGIAVISFGKEPVNSMGMQFWKDLSTTFEAAESDPEIRGIIFQSTLKKNVFTAGLDIQELYAPATNEERAREFWRTLSQVLMQIYNSRLATVAAINGACPAGGCCLALCCDWRIITWEGSMGLNEVALGMRVPYYWCELMARTCGQRAAEDLLLSATMPTSTDLRQLQLVDEIVEKPEDLLPAGVEKLQRWLKFPSEGYVPTKNHMRGDFAKRWRDGIEWEGKEVWKAINDPQTVATLGQDQGITWYNLVLQLLRGAPAETPKFDRKHGPGRGRTATEAYLRRAHNVNGKKERLFCFDGPDEHIRRMDYYGLQLVPAVQRMRKSLRGWATVNYLNSSFNNPGLPATRKETLLNNACFIEQMIGKINSIRLLKWPGPLGKGKPPWECLCKVNRVPGLSSLEQALHILLLHKQRRHQLYLRVREPYAVQTMQKTCRYACSPKTHPEAERTTLCVAFVAEAVRSPKGPVTIAGEVRSWISSLLNQSNVITTASHGVGPFVLCPEEDKICHCVTQIIVKKPAGELTTKVCLTRNLRRLAYEEQVDIDTFFPRLGAEISANMTCRFCDSTFAWQSRQPIGGGGFHPQGADSGYEQEPFFNAPGYLCNITVLRHAVRALEHWLDDLDGSYFEDDQYDLGRRQLYSEEWDAVVLYSELSEVVKPGTSSKGSGLNTLPELLHHCKNTTNRVVQKCPVLFEEWYVEKPLLLFSGRKFDLRQWVLVRSFQPLEVYMFSSCYLRLCNEPYDLGDLANRQRHISNWSVNKHGKHVATGAVASLSELNDVLEMMTGSRHYWENDLVPKLKECILHSLRSVQDRVVQRVCIADETPEPGVGQPDERPLDLPDADARGRDFLADSLGRCALGLTVVGKALNLRAERRFGEAWRQSAAQVTIARFVRGFLVRHQGEIIARQNAAKILQRRVREWRRRRALEMRLKMAASRLWQARMRGYLCSMLLNEIKRRERARLMKARRREAAKQLQCCWRGLLGRRAARAQRMLLAARRLQRCWRGWRFRQRLCAVKRLAHWWRQLLAVRASAALRPLGIRASGYRVGVQVSLFVSAGELKDTGGF